MNSGFPSIRTKNILIEERKLWDNVTRFVEGGRVKVPAKNVDKAKTARVTLPCNGRKILIADDESSIRDLFLQVVRYGLPNCRVDLAVNGEEAVEAFRNGRHAVMVMDLKMPVMDGEKAFLEIVKLCKAENWAMPAVVFCTGYDASGRIEKLVKENPSHCLLRKPVMNDELMEAIKARLPAE